MLSNIIVSGKLLTAGEEAKVFIIGNRIEHFPLFFLNHKTSDYSLEFCFQARFYMLSKVSCLFFLPLHSCGIYSQAVV